MIDSELKALVSEKAAIGDQLAAIEAQVYYVDCAQCQLFPYRCHEQFAGNDVQLSPEANSPDTE